MRRWAATTPSFRARFASDKRIVGFPIWVRCDHPAGGTFSVCPESGRREHTPDCRFIQSGVHFSSVDSSSHGDEPGGWSLSHAPPTHSSWSMAAR